MSKLRQAARDQPCVLEGWYFPCDGTDTTVLAHLPYHDAGMAQKCDDILGAHLCFSHHAYIDGKGNRDWEAKFVALRRTVQRLTKQGVIHG